MTQALLDLPAGSTTDVAAAVADPAARIGFQIGWDHAHHGLAPQAEALRDGTPLGQGWLAGKAVFRRRTLAHPRAVRQWLALRTLAWQQGAAFDLARCTPQVLAALDSTRCPVTRAPLGGAAGEPEAAVVERLDPAAGYTAGNLVVCSQRAADARRGKSVLQALRNANFAQAAAMPVDGLDAAAWWRLAALQSFATALPLHDAVRLPLALLPPPGVAPVNAVQRLQTAFSLLFAHPGWSARTRALAALLPAHSLRQDFNLFVGAFAPRVLEAEQTPTALPRAIEDAWLNERVQRRWQHLAFSLGETGVEALLEPAQTAARTAAQAGAAGSARQRQRPTFTRRSMTALPARLPLTLPARTPAPVSA